ncbi:RNA ligase family protein [Fibrisoma limi]|uniref:RNA ligase family protein n=1 Tax=Fibrisoma limi TaxID=663275 RepID=UPI001E2D6A1A|nr:RNA ligase family protein [Fibrisoma limi]
MSRYGVFARSHAAPSSSPWTAWLRERWQRIRHELGELEVFGENLYAIHSIRYSQLDSHFFVFAIRDADRWLSWEEVVFYTRLLDFDTVPQLALCNQPFTADQVQGQVKALAGQPSVFGSVDALTGFPCSREGIVSRNADGFPVAQFANNVFKYVRSGHVQTDEHWTRHWQRAPLRAERRTV